VTEHVIGMSGTAEVGPEGDLHVLEAGDCVSFSADRPHHYRAIGGPVRLLALTDYP
jgi:quercetin dioxygenase-like cupin family protein